MNATNRQKKVLNFFGISGADKMSLGMAGLMIDEIFSDEEARHLWDKYLYVTSDFDRLSPELKPHAIEELKAVEIPPTWNRVKEEKKANDSFVAAIVEKGSPFDFPEPEIEWKGRIFVLTGNFLAGKKGECALAIERLEGIVAGDLTASTDYLIVGAKGNPSYSEAAKGYGQKVKTAIIRREEFGRPAVVTEAHWHECLGKA